MSSDERDSSIQKRIMRDSAILDGQFISTPAEDYRSYSLSLPIPPPHSRAVTVKETLFTIEPAFDISTKQGCLLIDASLQEYISIPASFTPLYIQCTEDTAKEVSWLDNFIARELSDASGPLIAIGGGVLLNAAAYVAKVLDLDFISIPTTVLAAADSALGGLVRLNKVDGDTVQKDYIKSVYEPSEIIVVPKYLASLPPQQISFGLSEVIKHGVYQSSSLLDYLASSEFDPFNNQASLIKAICWTAALKSIVIINDPEEEYYGATILRGGHDVATDIEEASKFKVSHGEAVAVGIYEDNFNNVEVKTKLDTIYGKLSLPKSREDLT